MMSLTTISVYTRGDQKVLGLI